MMMTILPLPAALHQLGEFSNVANFFQIFQIEQKTPGPFLFNQKTAGPFPFKLSQLIRGAEKTNFFGGFLLVFCHVLCFFTDS